eukprot:GHVN01091866.1.p1 GENE.GHVN01091866.1~~GHVN01091866.1.p1  ORF type:complete len:300 (+),score=45.31 GHVN01091866.1:685-1584(+)
MNENLTRELVEMSRELRKARAESGREAARLNSTLSTQRKDYEQLEQHLSYLQSEEALTARTQGRQRKLEALFRAKSLKLMECNNTLVKEKERLANDLQTAMAERSVLEAEVLFLKDKGLNSHSCGVDSTRSTEGFDSRTLMGMPSLTEELLEVEGMESIVAANSSRRKPSTKPVLSASIAFQVDMAEDVPEMNSVVSSGDGGVSAGVDRNPPRFNLDLGCVTQFPGAVGNLGDHLGGSCWEKLSIAKRSEESAITQQTERGFGGCLSSVSAPCSSRLSSYAFILPPIEAHTFIRYVPTA